jgi:hypothetical protein
MMGYGKPMLETKISVKRSEPSDAKIIHLLAAMVVVGVLAMTSGAGATISSNGGILARAQVVSVPNYVTPVAAGDTIADRVLGQFDFFHNTSNFVDAESLATNTITAFAGVAIDTSSIPNRVYVADQVNNRVLGWASVAALTNNRPADIVIGQPDFFSTTCLGTPASTSLCAPGGVAVDGSGNVLRGGYRQQPGARIQFANRGRWGAGRW